MALQVAKPDQKLTTDNPENPIKSIVKSVDERLQELNGILGTAVSAVDGSFNSREEFNKFKNDVAKKYGIDSALSTINETMGLVKSFELALKGIPNDGSPKANYSQITKVGKYQYPSDLGGIYLQISLKEWKKLSAFGKNTMDTKTTIALPLPKNLVESHNVGYKQTSLGSVVGGMKQGALGAATGQTDDYQKRLTVSIGSALTEAAIREAEGAATKLAGAMPIGGDALASIATTTANIATEIKNALDNATEQALGLAYNPNLTLVLGGPTLRQHNFTWLLSAKNYAESKVIKDIVNELRKAMLPSSVDGFMYKYPNYALIRIHPKNDFLYKFKPCVIAGLTVNYAGAGYPSFMPGQETGNHPPTFVELSIIFQEVETIIRENIESGDEFLSNAKTEGSTVGVFDSFPESIIKIADFGLDTGINSAVDLTFDAAKSVGSRIGKITDNAAIRLNPPTPPAGGTPGGG